MGPIGFLIRTTVDGQTARFGIYMLFLYIERILMLSLFALSHLTYANLIISAE